MIDLFILGQSDLLEKTGWAKKYSGFKEGDEQFWDSQFELKQNLDILMAAGEPGADIHQVIPKLQPLGIKFPTTEEFELLNSILLRDFRFFCRFFKLDIVPGRPDYDVGFGFTIETNAIFLEEKLYKTVEKVSEKKKFGIFTEKVVSQERQLGRVSDLLGSQFNIPELGMAVTDKAKDNRDQMKYAVRFQYNINLRGTNRYFVDKVPNRWKDPADFVLQASKALKVMSDVLSRLYVAVGYDTPPSFQIPMGDLTRDRPITGFTPQNVGPGLVLETQYGS